MRYIRGSRKNVLLTVWLLLPIVFLGLIVYGIFSAYSGGQAMDARPVGQGAGDTGGANALGEWLAGHDVAAEERIKRDLREGRLIDPLEWPGGIKLVVDCPTPLEREIWVVLWHGRGSGVEYTVMGVVPSEDQLIWKSTGGIGETCRASVTIFHEELEEMFRDGLPGAGIYLSRSRTVREENDRLFDDDGNLLVPVEVRPVPAGSVAEGEMIEVWVTVEAD